LDGDDRGVSYVLPVTKEKIMEEKKAQTAAVVAVALQHYCEYGRARS